MFEAIDEHFGEVVGVAKETKERLVLEFGRVCVQTRNHQFLNQVVNLEVFSKVFPITV